MSEKPDSNSEATATSHSYARSEIEQLPDGEFVEASPEIQEGEATNEPRVGTELPVGETAEIRSKAQRPDDTCEHVFGLWVKVPGLDIEENECTKCRRTRVRRTDVKGNE